MTAEAREFGRLTAAEVLSYHPGSFDAASSYTVKAGDRIVAEGVDRAYAFKVGSAWKRDGRGGSSAAGENYRQVKIVAEGTGLEAVATNGGWKIGVAS